MGHDFHVDTHLANLKKVIDPSYLLAFAPSLEFSTISDTHEGSVTIHDPPLGDPEEGDGHETDASFDFELGDSIFKEHSLEEPYVMDLSEVTSPMKLVDPIHIESFLNLVATSLI